MTTAARPSPARHLFHPASAPEYAELLQAGLDHLVAHLGRLDGRASTGRTPDEAGATVDAALADVDLDEPLPDVATALAELSRVYLDDAVWFHEPRYAAHLNCPVLLPALLAEVFVSAVNSSLDTFDQSVGGTFVERRLVDWTARRIGFGPDADGVFTSGGTQSNLQALLIARDRALATGAAPADLRVVASADAHFSVQKAARLLGLGDVAVVTVPVDGDRRMQPAALSRTLARLAAGGHTTAAIVATAGTTDFGAVDPLREIAALRDLAPITATNPNGPVRPWLHVDAAYGGGLLASTRHRNRLAGIELADSVTVDYHKTWFQPVSCGALLVREGHHLGHVTWHADYLNPRAASSGRAEQPNQVDKSLQTTRRFDALKLWLSLRITGADTIGSLVDDVVGLADDVGRRLAKDREIELAATPQLSTVVLRYAPADLTDEEADRLVPLVRARLHEGGTMVAATRVDGRRWLKLTLLNPVSAVDDVMGIVEEIRTTSRALARPVVEVVA